MKECTLQEAISLQKEKGGVFYKKGNPSERFVWIPEDQIVHLNSPCIGNFFTPNDVLSTWIYEPPKTAFQEWNENQLSTCHPDVEKQKRKEGWNAAIEKVLELPSGLDKLVERIEALKEP